MLNLIADAATQATTQPAWSNTDVIAAYTALVTALVALIGGIAAGVVLIIKTVKANVKADLNSERLDRHTERMDSIESDQKELLLYTPPPSSPQRPATPSHEPPVNRSNPI